MHLSEWALVNGQRVWVNPLHRGGKLRPYADNVEPIVRAIYAYGPPAPWWSPRISSDIAAGDGAQSFTFDDLHGSVELRAWIDDSQGDVGLYRRDHHLATNISPYRIWVQIRRVDSRAIIFQRNVWQSDILLTGRQGFYAHFAAGSRPPLSDALCAEASDRRPLPLGHATGRKRRLHPHDPRLRHQRERGRAHGPPDHPKLTEPTVR